MSFAAPPTHHALKMWRCLACGLIYDEAEGWPEDGIAPRHALGGHPGGLVLPGVRRAQG